jgi:hypothetical protein
MLTMATQQTPAEILSWITDALASNKTIYVDTANRITKITPKVAQQFDAAGRPVFRASDKSLYMSVGRRYDCIDYCRITARSI